MTRPPNRQELEGAAPVALDGRRVLIVEDEFFIADDLITLLAAGGASALGPVGTVEAALQLLATHQPDFAILDINLRGKKVYPVADLLAERGVPFVFATGYEPDEIPARFDGVPCWPKPIDTSLVRVARPEKA